MVNYIGSCHNYSYSVIGIIEISHQVNISSNWYFSGKVTVARHNAIYSGITYDVLISDPYRHVEPEFIFSALHPAGDYAEAYPCIFKYNNKWYAGFQVKCNSAGCAIILDGTYDTSNGRDNVVNIDYYYNDGTTTSILNQEIYNSISTTDIKVSFEADLYEIKNNKLGCIDSKINYNNYSAENPYNLDNLPVGTYTQFALDATNSITNKPPYPFDCGIIFCVNLYRKAQIAIKYDNRDMWIRKSNGSTYNQPWVYYGNRPDNLFNLGGFFTTSGGNWYRICKIDGSLENNYSCPINAIICINRGQTSGNPTNTMISLVHGYYSTTGNLSILNSSGESIATQTTVDKIRTTIDNSNYRTKYIDIHVIAGNSNVVAYSIHFLNNDATGPILRKGIEVYNSTGVLTVNETPTGETISSNLDLINGINMTKLDRYSTDQISLNSCTSYPDICAKLNNLTGGYGTIGASENTKLKALLPAYPNTSSAYVTCKCEMEVHITSGYPYYLLKFTAFPTLHPTPREYYKCFVTYMSQNGYLDVSGWCKEMINSGYFKVPVTANVRTQVTSSNIIEGSLPPGDVRYYNYLLTSSSQAIPNNVSFLCDGNKLYVTCDASNSYITVVWNG